ncbi:Putative deoxyribonuclease YjjV [Pseudoalteromonas luteoviolacea B = ATCC 29581]|nr:Putative deoxyribonuclease YjjV [Pseudoalteromonas luteoviolacea B = ATCC 29581]
MDNRAIEPLIDTHCHLDFPEFDNDRESVLSSALAKGVRGGLVPGVTLGQCKRLLAFDCGAFTSYLAVGLHPYFITEHQLEDIDALSQLITEHRSRICAIGECGLDAVVGDMPKQQQLFIKQIELANQFRLPLVVHHRQSHHLIAQVFKHTPPRYGGVIHAFSGSLQQARYYIEKGFKLGVGGVITYARAQKTRNTVSQVPLSALLIETDSPSMPLNGYQGLRNEPAQLMSVFNVLSELRSESRPCIAKQLNQNFSQLMHVEFS